MSLPKCIKQNKIFLKNFRPKAEGVTLERWRSQPQQVPPIFRRLLAKNVAASALAFLDARLFLPALVALIIGLPWAP
jgi:hypothetical protein